MSSKIIISQQNLIHFIEPSEIIFCQSDNCYTSLYTVHDERYVIVKSLSKFTLELNSAEFIRVHQSYLINKKYIQRINRKKKCIDLFNNHNIPFTITLKTLIFLISEITIYI